MEMSLKVASYYYAIQVMLGFHSMRIVLKAVIWKVTSNQSCEANVLGEKKKEQR